jgi:hypothetical protein
VRAAYRGRALKFYADVHRTKRNGEGYRITYTTDGKNFQARRRLQRDSGRAWRQAIHGYTTGPAHGRCYITTREGEGSRVSKVFVDFRRGRVYALPEDGEEVMIFGDFLDV